MDKKLKTTLVIICLLLAGIVVGCGLTACGGGGGNSDSSGNGGGSNNPPPVSDPTDFGLPPDPGEAGKATLLGIDSNQDGLRDDIERWIVDTAPDSLKTQAALRQDAIVYTRALTDASDEDLSRDHAVEMDRAILCLEDIVGFGKMDELTDELQAQFLNTKERSQAYIKYDSHLGGVGGSSTNNGSTCDFDPSALPN